MTSPSVSVIALTYNQRDLVGAMIQSVLAQTHQDLQLVLTDDGSTDGTVEVLRDHAGRDDRVTLVTSPVNTGIAANFNRGLKARRGELIAWLGGDDVMLPRKLERQVATLRAHPEAVGCTHDAEVFDSESGRVLGRFSELFSGGPLRDGGVELWFDPTYRMLPSATMVRASAVPKHGFDERLRVANDWLFDVEVFRSGSCVALDEVLVRYRRHSQSVTLQDATYRRQLEEGLIALAVVDARYPELCTRAQCLRTALLIGEARRQARAGRPSQALRYGRAALAQGVVQLGHVGWSVARRSARRATTSA